MTAQERLRLAATKLRTTSMTLADLIPLLQQAADELDREQRVPEGWALVPQSLIDTFPEINPSNYDHYEACELNRWGCEVVTSAVSAPKPVAQPGETESILIDGVAHTVPTDVACELLRLHMELQAKPEQAAQPMNIEEIDAALQENKRIYLGSTDPARGAFILGVLAAERHHGIATSPKPKD